MADRFPLIVDSSAQQLQELAVGDNLNLASSGLINADNIQTSGLSVGVMTATSFIGDGSQLTNLPAAGSSTELTASGTLADGDPVVVNTDGTVSTVFSSGFDAWIALLGTTGSDLANSVAVDSSGNIYICGYSSVTTTHAFVAKYNSAGTLQWQRQLGPSGSSTASYERGRGIAIDSSGNVYIVGHGTTSSAGQKDVFLAKYDSSGTIQWQKTIAGSDDEQAAKNGIVIDSSDNIYIQGSTGTAGSGSNSIFVAKYNTSGSQQWQRVLYTSNYDDAAQYGSISVDGSGNVYVLGSVEYVFGNSNNTPLLAKYDASGNIQWRRYFGGSGFNQAGGCATDSSGNIYVVADANVSSSGKDLYIGKFDSSGNLTWQRGFGGNGTTNEISKGNIAIDSSNNIYVSGMSNTTGAGSYDFLITKWNSSGTLQYQRTLGTSGSDELHSIAVDSSGSLYLAGLTDSAGQGGYECLTVKLPDDGSSTGTYGSFTYSDSSSSSLGDYVSSFSSGNFNMSSSSSSISDLTGSLTDATANLTSSKTTISSLVQNLTAENYIGISNGAYSNGQTATVQLIGSVDDAQSSLTPGQKYYVQNDGSLSTTADTPSVLAGKAISSTNLVIKG